ncbi:zinc ribbon domain-containing protein [Alkalibacillus salilacus]|uniref:Ribosomal protein L40E/heme/copper-type cytochrome/quinol oxidase subunit 2 n=1 Tax=Alkalibacillus salilacus TaxID=284582 RepID=A0ABT9VHB4_9BACI|nr:zinc ribbon domain-containing protein [Alkalibacillus salilacus]MDQ0160250.1 ribosomal protein L40E/heme/copper-type cytochrome/quinol oxidase subunit 2 [Alkalibacillus salilacus]
MIYCRQCGVANPSDANYCYNDGYPLEHHAYPPHMSSKSRESCTQCGAWRHEHASYCHICGEAFGQLQMQTFTLKRDVLTFKREGKTEVLKSILWTVPLALVSMIVMIVVMTLSLNDVDEQSVSRVNVGSSDVTAELLSYNNYFEHSISRIRQANEEGALNADQTYLTWQENLLLSHGITFEQKEKEDVSELNNGNESYTMDIEVQNSKPQYVFLIVLLTGISALIYRRFRPRISLFSMAISAVSFAIWYLLPVAVLSLIVSDSLSRELNSDRNREISFQFVLDGTFMVWGFLLIAVFFVAQLWREKRSLPYVLEGAKRGSYWLVLIFLLFYVGSLIVVSLSASDGHYINVLMRENLFVNAGLVSGFLTILLINTGFLNTLNLKTAMHEESELAFHLFNQSVSAPDEKMRNDSFMESFDQYTSPLSQLSPWFWFSFVILMLACLLMGAYIKSDSLITKFKLAVGISLVFSIINSFLVIIMSQRMVQVFDGQGRINLASYDLLMTMFVTFGFVMVFVIGGIGLRYLWKGANTNESNRT